MSESVIDVFVHIPKTAGETLGTVLNRQYHGSRILQVPDPGPPASRSPSGESYFEAAKRLVVNTPENQFKLVAGHMPFGIHEAMAKPVRYFTMVRNPIERAISHYYYVKREARHWLHKEIAESGMTLHDYVTSGVTAELANGQTALLAGQEEDAPGGELSLLRQAQSNIETRFVAVGMTEEFDRSLVLFKLALGWTRPIMYESVNVTSGRPRLSAVSQKTIAALEEQNALDLTLYEFIQGRFEDQIMDDGSVATRELWRLRIGNAVYRHGPKRAMRWAWRHRVLRSRPPS